MSQSRSGGRYEIRDGKPVLVERSGHSVTTAKPNRPAPSAESTPPDEVTSDENAEKAPTGRA